MSGFGQQEAGRIGSYTAEPFYNSAAALGQWRFTIYNAF